MASVYDLVAFKAIVVFFGCTIFFGYTTHGYSLCASKTSPNCNATKTIVFGSVDFIWNKASLGELSSSLILQGGFLFAILLTSLLGNGALIATVVFEERFRTPTNFLVIGQCLADLFFGLTVVLLALIAAILGGWKLAAHWCVVQVFFNRFFLMLTFLNFALLAVDRYIVIVKTKNWNRFNKKQIFLSCALLWIVSVSLSLPWDFLLYPSEIWFEVTNTFCLSKYAFPVQQNSAALIFLRLVVFMMLPALVVIYCFYHIFGIVRTNRRKVGPSTVSNWRKIAVAVHAKSAYTSIAVVVSFALCILPFLLVFGMTIIGKEVSYAAMAATKCIYYTNTTIKPLIYISRNVPWSRKLRQLITRKRKIRRVITNSPAAKRSSNYEVVDYQKRKNIKSASSIPRTSSRKQLTTIDFHELFSVTGMKQAWDNGKKASSTTGQSCVFQTGANRSEPT